MKTVNITGFGGDYEVTAQKMLESGLEWLESHPGERKRLVLECFDDEGGLLIPDGEMGRALEIAIIRDVHEPAHDLIHMIMIHLLQIAKLGRTRWLAQFPRDRVFEYDGTEKSIPVRD